MIGWRGEGGRAARRTDGGKQNKAGRWENRNKARHGWWTRLELQLYRGDTDMSETIRGDAAVVDQRSRPGLGNLE